VRGCNQSVDHCSNRRRCYRRLDEWQKAGVWERLHAQLLAELRAAGEIEWSRAVADSSHVQAKKGLRNGPEPG
jgi:transposase